MKDELSKHEKLVDRVDHQAASVDLATLQFLNTEADTGLTLARIASTSKNVKRLRNIRNARKAYDTLLERRPTAAYLGAELEPIDKKIHDLKRVLTSLGEQFDAEPLKG